MSIKIWSNYLLILILLAGIVLRIYDLGAESLWYDEIGSIEQATRDLPFLFAKSYLSPAYFLFLKYWMRIFGMSEFALRFPSVIFGVGAIYLIYKLARELFNRKIGLLSSFILAISPFHLFYSQEVRHYGLMVFLSLLSMLFFLKIVENKFPVSNRLYACYVIINVLLLYTSLWAIFVIFIQNVFFFLQKIKQKKKWLVFQAIIFLAFLVWFIPFIIYFVANRDYILVGLDWVPKTDFFSLIDTFRVFSYGGVDYGKFAYYIDPKKIDLSPALLYILGILSIFGSIPIKRKEYDKIFFLAIWLFMPILTLFILSHFLPVYITRYIIFSSLAYYILIAKGIDRIKDYFFQMALISIIVISTLPALHFYYKTDIKIRWDQAIDYIGKNKKDNDIIVVARSDRAVLLEYMRIKNINKTTSFKIDMMKDLGIKRHQGEFVYNHQRSLIIGINDVGQLKRIVERKIIKDGDKVWFILCRGAVKAQGIGKYLGSFSQQKDERHFEGVSVFYYLITQNQ